MGQQLNHFTLTRSIGGIDLGLTELTAACVLAAEPCTDSVGGVPTGSWLAELSQRRPAVIDDLVAALAHIDSILNGTPDEVTLYGGTTEETGTAFAQSFPADAYTANLIPEAATNEWFLSLSEDGSELTYYLERHGKPRFKAVLTRD